MTVYTKLDDNNHISRCLPNDKGAVINLYKNVLRVFNRWIERAYQRQQLAKLDDRMLKDIGVSRADASNEIAKPFWR